MIKSDCKKRARLNAMRHVLHKLPYTNKDVAHIRKLDPFIVSRAYLVYARGESPKAIMERCLPFSLALSLTSRGMQKMIKNHRPATPT